MNLIGLTSLHNIKLSRISWCFNVQKRHYWWLIATKKFTKLAG